MVNYKIKPDWEVINRIKEDINKSSMSTIVDMRFKARNYVKDYELPCFILRKLFSIEECRHDLEFLWRASFQEDISNDTVFLLEELDFLSNTVFYNKPLIVYYLKNAQNMPDENLINIIKEINIRRNDSKLLDDIISSLISERTILSYVLIKFFASINKELTFDKLALREELPLSTIIDFKLEFRSRFDVLLKNNKMNENAYILLQEHKEEIFND